MCRGLGQGSKFSVCLLRVVVNTTGSRHWDELEQVDRPSNSFTIVRNVIEPS